MKFSDYLEEIEEWEYDLDYSDDKKLYDEYLDEVYGSVNVAGMTFDTSQTLQYLDPTAYRCGFNDFVDTLPRRFQCLICDEFSETKEKAAECCVTWYACEVCDERYDSEDEERVCCADEK